MLVLTFKSKKGDWEVFNMSKAVDFSIIIAVITELMFHKITFIKEIITDLSIVKINTTLW